MTAPADPRVHDRADVQRRNRKARDRSIVLVLVGTILLMPPIAGIFVIDDTLFGIPVPVLYVFLVLIALIVGAALLARSLNDSDVSLRHSDPSEGER